MTPSEFTHRYAAEGGDTSIFDDRVIGLAVSREKLSGRVPIDPTGGEIARGLVRTPRITHARARRRIGCSPLAGECPGRAQGGPARPGRGTWDFEAR